MDISAVEISQDLVDVRVRISARYFSVGYIVWWENIYRAQGETKLDISDFRYRYGAAVKRIADRLGSNFDRIFLFYQIPEFAEDTTHPSHFS